MAPSSLSADPFHQNPADTEGSAACAGCLGDCLDACFNDAIVPLAGTGVEIAEDLCAGCGACVAACGRRLVKIVNGVAQIVRRTPVNVM